MPKNKSYLFILVLIFCFSFFGSIFQSLYVYDPYHWGLGTQSSLDLLSNKKPYSEFFVHYGFLSVITKAIFLKIFNSNVISGMYLASFSFSLANLVFCAFIVKRFCKDNIDIIFISIIIFLLHPFANHPWYNYEFFLFVVLSIFFLNLNKDIAYFCSGFFLGLSCLLFESFFFLSLIIIFYIKLLYENKKFFYFTFGFLLPIFIFLFYIFNNNLISYWYKTFTITKAFLEIYETNLLKLVLDFFVIFFKKSFYGVLTEPYYLVFFIIFLTNIYFFIRSNYEFFFLKNKKKLQKELILISLFALTCTVLALHKINIFRLSTGLIIGIIIVFFYLNKKSYLIKNNACLLIIFFLTMSNLTTLKKENNRNFPSFYQLEYGINSSKFKLFVSQKWPLETWNVLDQYSELNKQIHEKCLNIKFFINFTQDAFLYIISNDYFSSKQYLYWHELNNSQFLLMKHFGKDIEKFIKDFNKKDTFIVVQSKNFFYIKNLIGTKEYNIIELPYTFSQKRKLVVLPSNCYKKIYDE